MKNNIITTALFVTFLVLLSSCGNKDAESESIDTVVIQSEVAATGITKGLQTEFLGNYHGIQPGYFMKNQYGEDMVINGNKVSVPSIDYKFLLIY